MTSESSKRHIIADGSAPSTPVSIEDYNADNDVLVINIPGISKKDISLVQQENDTLINLQSGNTIGILRNTKAADVDAQPLLKQLYDAYKGKDIDGIEKLLSEDIVWEVSGPTDLIAWSGKWNGKEGVRKFFETLSSVEDKSNITPKHYIVQGNTAAVICELTGRKKGTTTGYSMEIVQWITVRNGAIVSMQYYMDTFPIVESYNNGRPFSVPATEENTHYVCVPAASVRTTDNIIFDTGVFDNPPEIVVEVKKMYAALQGLNIPELRKVFAEDVIWDIFGPPDLLEWAGVREGAEAAADSADAILHTMHFDHFKPTRLLYDDKTAAVVIDEGGTSTATGLPFRTSVVHIIAIDDNNKVKLFRNYINTAWIVEAFVGGRPFEIKPAGNQFTRTEEKMMYN